MKKAPNHRVVGRVQPRYDGQEKITGKAIYTSDVELPGMAYGKILRSPLAHGKLKKVDAQKAATLPGVFAVFTREDLGGLNPYYGAAYKDQAVVATEKVRYVGDPVAAVAAADEERAEEALGLIEVEYEELPAVATLEEALSPNAPVIHESSFERGELHGYRYEPPKEYQGTNICYRFHYAKGNVDQAFKKAAHIFENTFRFPRVQHFSMEPHGTVAQVEGDHVTVWASTQDPFVLRGHLAKIFGISLNKVRVIVPHLGGGFGGKLSVKTEPLAAALSQKARRPVKIIHSVEESFKTVSRHPARVRLKTGVTRDGCLLARECEIYMDTGAYADAGPRVTQKAGYRAIGPYRIPHVKTDAYTVYTNTVPAGAFRGFGSLQVTWAYESQMDIIAEKLGKDPLQIRLKNLLKEGELYTPGDTPIESDLKEGLLKVAKLIRWNKREKKPMTGRGLSVCMKDGGGTYKNSSAVVKMIADGSPVLLTGTVEMGQGAQTALSQVVAEELGVPLSRVTVAQLDTSSTPFDPGTNASSSTVVMGLCALRAARDVKRQLTKAASKALQEKPDRVILKNARAYNRQGKSVSYEDLMASAHVANSGEITGHGYYQDKKDRRAALGSRTTFWEVSWGGAEVQIDPETGQIKLLQYVSAADAGKAIHPLLCQGQDEGGVMTAIGHSLLEEMVYENCQLLNPNLVDYRVPTFRHLPEKMESILVENANGPGPYGSKGIGEAGLLPVASAISNAVYQAIGVRFYDLPITPEKVWRAIRGQKAGKLGDSNARKTPSR